MSNNITIKVTVDNIKSKSNGKYTGDFSFEQTAGSPTITDSKGNLDLSDLTGETDISFDWASPTVTIDGQDYSASFYFGQYTGDNILIAPGKDSDPVKKGSNPPIGGDQEFTVNESSDPGAFTLVDKNSDGKKYAYCLVAFVDIGSGAQIIDDPKIINRPD